MTYFDVVAAEIAASTKGIAAAAEEVGSDAEVSNAVWVRQGDQGYWVELEPKAVR